MKTTIKYEGVTYTTMPKKIPQNLIGISLEFYIKDDTGAIFNITGKTITFQIREIGATTNKIDSPCVILDSANGKCKYTFLTGDLNTKGVYEAELTVVESTTYKNVIKLGLFGVVGEL